MLQWFSLSLSLLISMATVKSLTSMPGLELEGSLLRCQGHIGRSDRQRLREGRKTRWRVGRRREKDTFDGRGKCVHNVRVCVCARACVWWGAGGGRGWRWWKDSLSLSLSLSQTHTHQGLTLASDIGHLTNKICKCPIDVSYKRTNVLLICYKGGHCPIKSSFTRTSRPAFFFFFFFFI